MKITKIGHMRLAVHGFQKFTWLHTLVFCHQSQQRTCSCGCGSDFILRMTDGKAAHNVSASLYASPPRPKFLQKGPQGRPHQQR